MAISLDSTSRFKQTEPVNKDGKETFGLWVRPEALKKENLNKEQIKILAITQANAGRPDLIAYDEYGSQYLDWIIIMFNRPLNTLNWPQAGLRIEIPIRSVILGKVL